MLNLNRAMVLGNATRDPEMRYTPNGRAVTNLGVATNRRWTSQDGGTQEKTEFHEIVAWGKLAEIASQIIQKGAKVYVEGRLETRSWEAPDGSKRQKTEIVAENIIALSPRPAGATGGTGGTQKDGVDTTPADDMNQLSRPESVGKKPSSSPSKSSKEKDEKKKDEEAIDLDDIPF